MPSRYKVSPEGTVLNVRFTFVGQISTDLVSVRPDESVTVSVIRYLVSG